MPAKLKRNYAKENLELLVKDSINVTEVMRKLGIDYISGSMHSYISSLIRKYQIDTSHFLGSASNRGETHKGGLDKKKPEDILVLHLDGNREKSYILRKALLKIGRIYFCNSCGVGGVWNNKPITLEVDHINGNGLDNRAENLRFLCPNCHSQTTTHSSRKNTSRCVETGRQTTLRM